MKTHSFKRMVISVGMLFLLVIALSLIYVGLFVDEKPAFLNKGEAIDPSKYYLEDAINYGDIRPPTAIVFEYEGKVIGQIEWGTGEFQFVGEADQSAKIFFEYFLRPYIDAYIEDELRRRKE